MRRSFGRTRVTTLSHSRLRDARSAPAPRNGQAGDWAHGVEAEPSCVRFEDIPEAPALGTIEELLDWVLVALRTSGVSQAVVVDLTRTDLAIPVVHVTVPGLEGPFGKPGYTPGPRMQRLLRHRWRS